MFEVIDGKKLRCGYTTGSCAQAATLGCIYLLKGIVLNEVEIETKVGIKLKINLYGHTLKDGWATCYALKDAGDDLDVTDGIKIYVKVRKRKDFKVLIDGGVGIGRFIEDTPYGKRGEAAINRVPKEMIEKEVRGHLRGADVIVYAPEGEEVAKKTFNGRLKIEGGISILGTTGIVRPMSNEALLKTIFMELELKRKKTDEVVMCFGNHGEEFAIKRGLDDTVIISNFVGDALQYAKVLNFKKVTLVGHFGKLCKVSIGAFNTHSHISDLRMESFVYFLAKNHISYEVIDRVDKMATAEEAVCFLVDNGYNFVILDMLKGAINKIKQLVRNDMEIRIIMYTFRGDVFDSCGDRTW
ncbi:cobalt-precorrin-5B (C(1))-methyltransferase CbiD [Caloramator proteoclasticus]|uniref:Cobalt-precorrin-5B C(1)-methyltransferase n=1 Tax=Caloramator proteoclasticus DSM 10124 TaxID=1121262 RepID=A0A1M4S8U1_9CLOT|nr:cobalt-precorrin-5B (C(1))-methyltransferase CbiD [Caloramator proteoclasticus]SHE28624.1 cobalt-precorrin 5B C1-methyltransferase [Caloramator proteoclasticus DSM 10124]